MPDNTPRAQQNGTPLTAYPLNLPGRIYGSAMPFGLYDPEGTLLPGGEPPPSTAWSCWPSLMNAGRKRGGICRRSIARKGLSVLAADSQLRRSGRWPRIRRHHRGAGSRPNRGAIFSSTVPPDSDGRHSLRRCWPDRS